VLESKNPPFVTNPMTPASLTRSLAQRIARMEEPYQEFLFVAVDRAA